MNYHLRSKPKSKFSGKAIAIGVFFLILCGLAYLFPDVVRNTTRTVSLPFWHGSSALTGAYSHIKEFFIFKNTLISENAILKAEAASLKLKEMDYDILMKENQDLKNQLGRLDISPRILSKVLSKPPSSPYDTFILDAGSNQGVALGNKVYLSDNVIIGLIKNVTPRTSLVELFSSSAVKQESVLSRTGASYGLNGNGGANFVLEVPKDADILWGDVFIYPALTTSVIGAVYYIDTNSQSAFKTVYIRIPGNVFTAQSVYIEK